MHKSKAMKYPLILFVLLGFGRMQAQEVMSASGGNLSGSAGSVSFTVGQINYITYTGPTGTVNEGVQHPYEIFVVTGINEYPETEVLLDLYPNPSAEFVILKLKNQDPESLTYELWNSNGIMVMKNQVVQEETVLDLEELSPAVYYLQIFNNATIVKTFKIIKN